MIFFQSKEITKKIKRKRKNFFCTMNESVKIFEESTMIGGYALAVRDDWSYKIKRVNVTEEEKNAYLKEFGENIVTFDQFFNWWVKFNDYGNYSK